MPKVRIPRSISTLPKKLHVILSAYHLRDDQLYQPRRYRTVEVSGPVESWPDWAAQQGISYSTLREENPWIRAKQLTNKTGKTYKVKIPTEQSMSRKSAGTRTYNKAWVSR